MKYDIPDEFKQFVANVKRQCTRHKIELMMSPSRTVVITDSYSTDCSGYFDDVDMVLVVACGKPFKEWIEVLIHEYSHMQQWEDDNRWDKWTDCCGKLWEWIDHDIELEDDELNDVINGMIELERDCELRALENIEKWNLPINKSMYKRRANLYLYSYRMLPKIKKFPTGIYTNTDLVQMCAPRINKNYNMIPDNIEKEILRLYM